VRADHRCRNLVNATLHLQSCRSAQFERHGQKTAAREQQQDNGDLELQHAISPSISLEE
jgi:hypothetical protein